MLLSQTETFCVCSGTLTEDNHVTFSIYHDVMGESCELSQNAPILFQILIVYVVHNLPPKLCNLEHILDSPCPT